MAGLLAVALAGSAQAATMFAVQNSTGTQDMAAISDAGDIAAQGTITAAKIGVNVATPDSGLAVAETTTNAVRGIISSQHNDGIQAAYILFRKSRGTSTAVAPGAFAAMVKTGDYTGSLDASGWDGYNYLNGAGAAFLVDGPVVQGDPTITPQGLATYPGRVPTAFVVLTGNKTGSLAASGRGERFRVASDGRLRISNQPAAPVSGTTACTAGDLILDAANASLYLCTAAPNTWKKATFN